ncbi:hypothetical protein EW145_g1578 [Phellinidium pouzarii]|uniref:MFS general substrate transporter n=1 Tax=Phellinidium pouzarii TaxID=167371 RepID=A0A4S4LFW4_9AGAM|nr:hypothetical protein EW145_g1578 [Phellinidium pouzarii]
MSFPSAPDPDPTTQMAWPTTSTSRDGLATGDDTPLSGSWPPTPKKGSPQRIALKGTPNAATEAVAEDMEIGRKRLTTFQLFKLSVSMAGAQIAWTVELGSVLDTERLSCFRSDYRNSAISDSSKSRYRRRYWVVTSTGVLCMSTFVLAYCKEIAALFVDVLGGGVGSWDPKRQKQVGDTAIGFAVVAFYFLDFSLNALQASLRNLLLDVTPPSQLNSGNAWHGRMTHAGNIIGYGFGFLPLAQLPILRLLGGSQFRKFCVIAVLILVITVSITCIAQDEKERQPDLREKKESKFIDVLRNIRDAVVNLPKPIRRVCYVQFFAFMGWFPFLFYATTYVGQVMAMETGKEPDSETATRMGYLGLLWFSVVAVIAGTLLPNLARRDQRLLAHDGDEEDDAEVMRIRDTVREWRAAAAMKGKPLKLPRMPFMLRNIWTAAMLLFTILTFLTFFVKTVVQAIIVVSLIGICWAVACWVPFAMIMEFLKEMGEATRAPSVRSSAIGTHVRNHFRNASSPAQHRWVQDGERQPLIRRRSLGPVDEDGELVDSQPIAGGTVLGIHNLAIVMPQFIVAIVASAIFRAVDSTNDPNDHNTYLGKSGVAWVLRFGGLCTLVGAFVARMVPPTKTEKDMRRRLDLEAFA